MRANTVVLAGMLLALAAGSAMAQGRTVSGTVRDSLTGDPINGASVTVRGTTLAALTDPSGRFSVANAPAGDLVLQVRALGYFRRDVPVGSAAVTVDLVLARDVFKLEEIVVSGQATGTERRNLPNAVATLSAEELANHPTVSIEHQLQGKVAGADIQSNSGAPGGGVQVRLRGITSINADAQPLYVVDGLIVSDVAIASNANAITGAASGSNPALTQDGQVNRIADLNPSEIESIEILKGASAAAIYGGRAANGVVIITTKRGRQGAPRIELTQRFGSSMLLRRVGTRRFADAAEANDWRDGAGDQYCSGGTCPFFDHEDILADNRELSWMTSANISGGTEATRYFASGSMENTSGIVLNTGFSRQSVRLNLDQRFSDRVNVSLNTNIVHTEAERGFTNNDNNGIAYFYVLTGTPSLVDLRESPNGTFPQNPFQNSNPIQTASLSGNEEDVWRFLASSRLQWTIFSGDRSSLRFDAVGGLDFFDQRNGIFSPPELQYEPLDGFLGTSLLSNSDNLNLNLDGNAVHTFTGGGFTARTSAGVQFARRELDIARTEARDLVAGQENVDAGTSVRVRQDRSLIKNLGFFAQEELLLLNQRLNLTAGIRADQSSLNADASQLHWYPKLAASYRIERAGGWLDEIKFRGAFGQTGNEPLYGQRFTPLNSQVNIGGIAGTVVLGTTGSAELKPEREQEIEVGVDAQLFNNRSSLEASWYQKNVSDLLLTRNLPPSSGFAQEIFNGGKLRTRGLEVAAAVVPIQSRDAYWFFRTTFALSRSTVTELPVPPFETGGFGAILGVFQVEEGKSATQIIGTDTLPDGSPSPNTRVLGDATPDFKMSFTSSLNWKRLTLYALVDWQKGGNVINLTRLLADASGLSPDVEAAGARITGWIKGAASTYVESATYAKVREVAVSYDLPTHVAQALWGGIRSARLSLSARNLFWFATPYSGYDPEVSNFGNQPIARNIEVAPYPAARTFYFTINLGL